MARWDPEQIVSQSLLERLIDLDPKNQTSEPAVTRAQTVRQLKGSVRRDLEWLFNSRRTPEPAGSEYEELERSVYNYGLPDLSSLNWQSARDRQRLCRMLEQALALFEPRLRQPKVMAIENSSTSQHVLRFQIEGMLDMTPAPEHISFDTVLQLSSGEYQVKGEPSAG
jgi:type VI secretion system protein ImpF